MLLYEMFSASTDLKSAVEEAIMYLKANGLQSISIEMLVSILRGMGYGEVTDENIQDVLHSVDGIVSIDSDTIKVTTTDTVRDGEDEYNKEKVSQMASKYVQSKNK